MEHIYWNSYYLITIVITITIAIITIITIITIIVLVIIIITTIIGTYWNQADSPAPNRLNLQCCTRSLKPLIYAFATSICIEFELQFGNSYENSEKGHDNYDNI